MKRKFIVQLAICFFALAYLVNGQIPVPTPDLDKLPKSDDGALQGEIRERIVARFCQAPADCGQFVVKTVDDTPRLPDVKIYSIARPYHYFAYHLEYENESYDTIKPGDFEKFLADYQILAKSAALKKFLKIYRYFRMDGAAIHPFYIVDAARLKRNSDELRKYETGFEKLPFKEIHAPKLKKNKDGSIEIELYIYNDYKIVKTQISISANYEYQEKSAVYQLEKPATID